VISIQLNGQDKTLPAQITLTELLRELAISNQSIAVALNEEIIPRSEFSKVFLQNQDRIEIIQPIGGG